MPTKRSVFFLVIAILTNCRHQPHQAFTGAIQAIPAEMHGELQGMPAHWSVEGTGGAVSSANAIATEAGINILKAGGNAIDAILAVQWMLTVTEPQSSGIGGGGFLLYYEAKTKKVYALDGRETAPAAVDAKLFLDSSGKPMPFKERLIGARSVGVPGTVALLTLAKKRFGSDKVSFARTFAEAIGVAKEGLRVSPRLAHAMALGRERLIGQNSGSTSYLKGDEPYRVAEIFYQPQLARTLAEIAETEGASFYEGSIARDIIATLANRSSMAHSDLKNYRAIERIPETLVLAQANLWSIPAPASGRAVLETLQNGFVKASDSDLLAGILSAEKKAFAKRELELEDPQKENTTHMSAIDNEGNIVSYTSSVEISMGSAIEVRGRGFILNNQLTDFNPEPGKINSVAPGKRPKSSMSPLILRYPNGSYYALGSPGGATIVGTNALVAARLLSGVGLADAINAPRGVILPNGKGILELPLRRDPKILQHLKSRGVEVDLTRRIISIGSVHAVGYDAKRKVFIAASDLRREGQGLVVVPKVD